MHNSSSFPVGTMVTWVEDTPAPFRKTVTRGPMQVVGGWYNDGIPNDYVRQFDSEVGFNLASGWILTVEFDADTTDYYDPPPSLLFGRKKLRTMVHEKWLVRA